MTDVESEISALDDVIFRFMETDDSKLEAPVRRVIPKLIRRLSEVTHPQLRNKIVEVFSHLNKRFRLLPNFKYPLAELLDVFIELGGNASMGPPVAKAFASNFCLIYLEKAFRALPSASYRLALLPLLLVNITHRPPPVRLSVLKLALETLSDAGSSASHLGAGTDLLLWEEERVMLEAILTRLRREADESKMTDSKVSGAASAVSSPTAGSSQDLVEEAKNIAKQRGVVLTAFTTDYLGQLCPSPAILALARRALYASTSDLSYLLEIFLDILLFNPHAAIGVASQAAHSATAGSLAEHLLSSQVNPLLGPNQEQLQQRQAAREEQEKQKYILATAGISRAGVARLTKILPSSSNEAKSGGAQRPTNPTPNVLPNIMPQTLEQLKLAIVEFLFAGATRVPVDIESTERERENERLARQAEADAELENDGTLINDAASPKSPSLVNPSSLSSSSLLREICKLNPRLLGALGVEIAADNDQAQTAFFDRELKPILSPSSASLLLQFAATSMGADRAVHRAEDALKRISRSALLDNEGVIRRLFHMCLGLECDPPELVDVSLSSAPNTTPTEEEVRQYRTRSQLSDQLKVKVLGLLSNSTVAPRLDPKLALRLVIESLFPKSQQGPTQPSVSVLSLKLQSEAVRFATTLLSRSPPNLVSGYAAALLPILRKVLTTLTAARDQLRSQRSAEASAARSLAALGPIGALSEAVSRVTTSSAAVLDSRSTSLRGFVFNALGILANKAPKRVNTSLDLFELMLKPLLNDGADELAAGERDEDVKGLLQSAQGALAMIRPVFSIENGCTDDVRSALKKRLIQLCTGTIVVATAERDKEEDSGPIIEPIPKRVQILAMQYINDLWPFNDSEARILNLFQLANPYPEVRTEARRGLIPRSSTHSSPLSGAQVKSEGDEGKEESSAESKDASATSRRASETDDKDLDTFTSATVSLSASQALDGPPNVYPSFIDFLSKLGSYVRFNLTSSRPPSSDTRGWGAAIRAIAGQHDSLESPMDLDPRTLERTLEFAQNCLCASSLLHCANLGKEDAASSDQTSDSASSASALVAQILSVASTEAVDVTEAERIFAASIANSKELHDYTVLIQCALNASSVFHGGADGTSRPQEIAMQALLRLIQAAPETFSRLVIPQASAMSSDSSLSEVGQHHEATTGESFFKRMLGFLHASATASMRYAAATIISHMTPVATSQQLVREILSLLPSLDNPKMPARMRAAVSLITRLQNLGAPGSSAGSPASMDSLTASEAWATSLSGSLHRFYEASSKRGRTAAASVAPPTGSENNISSMRQAYAQLPGSLLALGCMLSELVVKSHSFDEATRHVVSELVYFCLHLVAWWITPGSKSVTEHPEATAAALLALARIGEAGPLPLPIDLGSALSGDDKAVPASVKAWQGGVDGEPLTARSLLALLVAVIAGTYQKESGPDSHAQRTSSAEEELASNTPRQAARVGDCGALAIGLLCVGNRNPDFLSHARLALIALGAIRHEEVQFAIGQAVCLAAAGREVFNVQQSHQLFGHTKSYVPTSGGLAPYLRELYGFKPLQISAAETNMAAESDAKHDEIREVLTMVLEKLEGGSLAARAAACIWMLCICSQLGGKASFAPHVHLAQDKLMLALTESDQFMQECAAKALGALHDAVADPAMKKELIDKLLQTFTTGQTRVTADTVIEGSVRQGRARSAAPGSSMGPTKDYSTYRDLLAVANEMGQPSLVYRFMDLAAHHSVWNSKVGAAFSLSHILKRSRSSSGASDQMSAEVLALVPRLYRYRFDPTEKVRASMNALWKLLITDSSAAINAQFDEICRDIIPSMSQRNFRTRYSACMAMADLLGTHGIPAAKFPPLVDELWPLVFRALDDVNSEGRKAGHTLAKALHALVVRLANPRLNPSTASSTDIVASTLPHILNNGIASKVREVRSVSLRALLAICEIASPAALRPHLPATITTLAEGLSSLEPSTLAYLQFHAASFDMTQEQLEAARVQMGSHTPLASAFETCLGLVDADSAAAVCKSLEELIRQGVGLQTLAASAKAIVTLISGPNAHRYRAQLVDRMAPLAKTLCAALAEPSTSPTLRKAYAVALAHSCKIAKRKRVMKVVNSITGLFGVSKPEAEEEGAMSAVSSVAPLPAIVSTHPGRARLSSALAVRELCRVAPSAARAYASDLAPLAFMGMHLSRKTAPTPVPDALRALPLILSRGGPSSSTLLGIGPLPSGGRVGPEAPRGHRGSEPSETPAVDQAAQLRQTLMEQVQRMTSAAGIHSATMMGDGALQRAAEAAGVNLDALISAVSSTSALAGVRAGLTGSSTSRDSAKSGGSALDDAEDAIAAVTGDAQQPEPEDAEAAELFAETWTELCSGNTMGALLFASDIISLAGAALQSADVPYSIKAVALRTLESLCLVLYRSARQFRHAIWDVLSGVLDETRIWQGKERLFATLAAFACAALDDSSEEDSPMINKILTKCIQETRRARSSYRNRAIAAAGQLLGMLQNHASKLKIDDHSLFEEIKRSIIDANKPTIGAIETNSLQHFGQLIKTEDEKESATTEAASPTEAKSSKPAGDKSVATETSTGLDGTKRQSLKFDSLQYELTAVAVTNAIPTLATEALTGDNLKALSSHFKWALAVFTFGLRGGFGWNARSAAIEGMSYLFQQLAALASRVALDQFLEPELVSAVIENALLPELNEPRFAQIRMGVLDALANGLQLAIIASSVWTSHTLSKWYPIAIAYRRVETQASTDSNADVARAATKLISLYAKAVPKLAHEAHEAPKASSTPAGADSSGDI